MNLSKSIQSVILSNMTTAQTRRVGIEVESLFYSHDCQRLPVNPTDRYSATDLIGEISNVEKSVSYTLEPGGQLEWASPPFISLHDIYESFTQHRDRVYVLAKEHGLLILDLSLEPLVAPEEIDLVDQKKYRLMHELFSRTGKMGPWMMRNTTSVQINLDVISKTDAEEMAFLADVFQPISTLLFANSPFMLGKPTGKRNVRYHIWSDTDPNRCGSLFEHGLIEAPGLLLKYAEFVQRIPSIFRQAQNGETLEFKGSLGDNLRSHETLDEQSVLSVLRQVFTHVRFKNVLEIRGSDRPPFGFEMAPVAFWIGLLTGIKTRNKVRDLADSFSIKDRNLFNELSGTLDMDISGPEGLSLRVWVEKLVQLSLYGLDERALLMGIKNERKFLEPFLENYFNHGAMSLQIQNKYKNSGISLSKFLRKRCEEIPDRN